jgi:MFS family permease
MLGPVAGGVIVNYFHWRAIFFLNIPVGLAGLVLVWRHLPDFREHTHPLDLVGLILFGAGIALLSYVLEIFGEHQLSTGEVLGLLAIALALLLGYALHAKRIRWPLLRAPLTCKNHDRDQKGGARKDEFHPSKRRWIGR